MSVETRIAIFCLTQVNSDSILSPHPFASRERSKVVSQMEELLAVV